MDARAANKKTVHTMVTSPYWEERYAGLFSDGFSIHFPSAPPGMPQIMDSYEAQLFMSWMRRSVKNWAVELEELHGTKHDQNLFWTVGYCGGDVCWGGREGKFRSKFIMKVTTVNGKIAAVSMMMDPLKFLDAAGIQYPVFRMDIDHPSIERYLREDHGAAHGGGGGEPDLSALGIKKRIQGNLDAFRGGAYWDNVAKMATYADDLQAKVWFLPPEMGEAYPPEAMPRVDAWSVLSCPEIEFEPGGKTYEADDELVYFGEYRCRGKTRWLGNGVDGHYRNHYFYILRMNEKGEIQVSEEFLNPVNKFNSINVSIPTFPYYL